MGTGDVSLRVSAWYVEQGDAVEQGDPVLEVMFPGITCDIPAPVSGTIHRISASLDDVVYPGLVVGWIAPQSFHS